MSRKDQLLYEIELIKAHLKYRFVYGLAELLENTLSILEQELKELEEKNVEKLNNFTTINRVQSSRTEEAADDSTAETPDEDAD